MRDGFYIGTFVILGGCDSGINIASTISMSYNQTVGNRLEVETFESPTEEEIIGLWRSLKSSGLSGDQAWHAIVTSIALDRVFSPRKGLSRVEH